jgi:peptidyl-dipeptidase A
MLRNVCKVGALLGATLAVMACTPAVDTGVRREAQAFLDDYTAKYVELYTASSEAEWISNTRIIEGDDTNRKRTEGANQALTAFTGSVEVIEDSGKLDQSGGIAGVLRY